MEIIIENYIAVYSEYKDSGTEWLGNIPEIWDTKRMKYLFRDVSIKGKPDAELLSVTQDKGVIPRTWVENRMVMPTGELHTFKFIAKGDFAISLRSFEGGLESCYHDGIVSPAYTVLKSIYKINQEYYKYLFKSYSFISELQTSVVGIRQGKNISYQMLCNSIIPIPPLEEQTAIASFLDRKTALIDQAIEIKQKQIELLKERKQILIQNAVTRGLNPNVKMKDSGVDWIGEIPEHWEVKPLKIIADLESGESISPDEFIDDELGFPVYGGNGFRGYTSTYTNDGYFALIGRQGALCGNVNYVSGKFYATEHAIVVYPKNHEDILWLGEAIKIADFNRLSQSAAQPGIAVNTIKNIKFPFPNVKEQADISFFIKNISGKIISAITLKENEIEKLKEYKSTLINSAVTGKIKVC